MSIHRRLLSLTLMLLAVCRCGHAAEVLLRKSERDAHFAKALPGKGGFHTPTSSAPRNAAADPWPGTYTVYESLTYVGAELGSVRQGHSPKTITITKDGEHYRLSHCDSNLRLKAGKNGLYNTAGGAPILKSTLVEGTRVVVTYFSFHRLYLVNGPPPKTWYVAGEELQALLERLREPIPPPTDADVRFAKMLPDHVTASARAMLDKKAAPTYSLRAARQIGSFVLLALSSSRKELKDVDAYLIYDPSVKKVVCSGGWRLPERPAEWQIIDSVLADFLTPWEKPNPKDTPPLPVGLQPSPALPRGYQAPATDSGFVVLEDLPRIANDKLLGKTDMGEVAIDKSFRLQVERLQIKGEQASLTLSLNPARLPNVNYRLARLDGHWQVERPSLIGTWECSQRDRLSNRAAEHNPFRLILRSDRRLLASGREKVSPYGPAQPWYVVKGDQLIITIPEAPALFSHTFRLEGDKLFLKANFDSLELLLKKDTEAEFRRVKE